MLARLSVRASNEYPASMVSRLSQPSADADFDDERSCSRRWRVWGAATGVALSTLCAIPSALAQEPPRPAPAPQGANATDNRALAETLFFTARGMMEAGRYEAACEKLTESYRLDPAAGTLLNLAVCHQKSGRVASAWGEFRQALADANRANRPDRAQLATAGIAELEPELPFLTIVVPPAIKTLKGLVITRNGTPLQSAAWDTDLPVDPGKVEVVETAAGYKPKTLYVSVTNKQHASLTLESLELAPIERPPERYWTGRRVSGVVLIGGAAAFAVVGTVFGLSALTAKNNSDARCPVLDGQNRCDSTGADDMSKARTDAWVSDIGFGLAGVGLLAGAYFLLTGGHHEEDGPPNSVTLGSTGWSMRVGAGTRSAEGLLFHSF
jgi:hypothetical protein